jgi:tRNA A37 threonylcarbamoyladenosine synthetase subunit TsaC/SUA5/YrdC
MSPTSKIIRQLLVRHQNSLAFTSVQLSGMNSSQKARALSCLANLLMLAAGCAIQEADDDQC